MIVAKYLFVTTFWNGVMFSSVTPSSKKNSWNERRPTLATESSDVKANAETAKLINVNTKLCGLSLIHIYGRCSVVEVMGRKRGYIALWAGMATSAEAIVLPEKWNGNYDTITDAIKQRHAEGRNSYLVVVAEGVTDAPKLAEIICKKTGIESRVSVLGYIQRGGNPTAKDRMYGSLMGAYAVEILTQGKQNRIVAIKNDKMCIRDRMYGEPV